MGSTLTERIATASDKLTPSERRLAALILDDSTILAFHTVAEIAHQIDSSGPTIVRFATKLGFDGFSALQHEAQQLLREELKRPTDRIRHQPSGDVWAAAHTTSMNAVESVFNMVTSELIQRLAAPIASSPGKVWIVASENSAAAQVLTSGLQLLRAGVQLVSDAPLTSAMQIAQAEPDDVVVAIDFSRYERRVVSATKALADSGLTVIAITDSAFSPLTAVADVWCEIAVPAVGPFDSALPAIAVVETLLAEIAHRLPAQATERIDRAEAEWSATDIFTAT